MDRADDAWSVPAAEPLGRAWRACLESAILAPSVLNTQPWRFRAYHYGVDVFADPERMVADIDPRGRELTISVGAAIFNLRVAILARGRKPLVRLLPESSESNLLAHIGIGYHIGPDAAARTLSDAIPQRHTNRQPFSAQPLPRDVLRDVFEAATAERAGMTMADELGRMYVLGLVRRAEHTLRAEPEYRMTLQRWAGDRPGAGDGVPSAAFGPWSAMEALPLRDHEAADVNANRARVEFESEPTIMALYTDGDDPVHWLIAGQALQRVLLTATSHGVATTPMTQPLELAQLRERFADPLNERVMAQAIMRLGYGPKVDPTPRRPLEDVLI